MTSTRKRSHWQPYGKGDGAGVAEIRYIRARRSWHGCVNDQRVLCGITFTPPGSWVVTRTDHAVVALRRACGALMSMIFATRMAAWQPRTILANGLAVRSSCMPGVDGPTMSFLRPRLKTDLRLVVRTSRQLERKGYIVAAARVLQKRLPCHTGARATCHDYILSQWGRSTL